ncbi:MAG TPA: hypothetical protein VFG89_00430 [Coriobacteriia bacterium]|nr:hypothetical protein [Coriobacteriia bacterium]
MSHVRTSRVITLMIAIVMALVLAIAATGCSAKKSAKPDNSGSSQESTSTGEQAKKDTAKSGIEVARAALSTSAPEAKLLMVQTATAVSATSTPVWGYLFGSPKTDKTYVVYVVNGEVMRSGEYGKAGMSAKDWAQVGAADAFKIDSDEAYTRALAVSGAKQGAAPPRYLMGLQTYVSPDTAKKTGAAPYTWYVVFDPGASGATSSTIDVDGNTGKALVHPTKKK